MLDKEYLKLKRAKVLLIGGTGFIGCHILELLVRYEADVTILSIFKQTEYQGHLLNSCRLLKGTIKDESIKNAILQEQWDYAINVGGFINQRRDFKSETEAFDNHFFQVRDIVNFISTSKLKRYIHCGSALEYGDIPPLHSESLREQPLTPYAVAKVACTHYLQMLHRTRNFPVVILRPFLVYGPGQDLGKFIPWAINEAMSKRPIKMTPGEQTRDPICVKDVARAFINSCVVDEKVLGEIINVASGQPLTISQIAKMIVKVLGYGDVELGAYNYRDNDIMRSEADVSKLKDLLYFSPNTDFEGNLRMIIRRAMSDENIMKLSEKTFTMTT